MLELKIFLLFSNISNLPFPRFYRALKAKSLFSASSAGGSLKSQGNAVSLRPPVRASAGYISESDRKLIYGSGLGECNSARRSLDDFRDEGAIILPSPTYPGYQHSGHEAETHEKELVRAKGMKEERGKDNGVETSRQSYDVWCCICSEIHAFQHERCGNCKSTFCASCIRGV